MATVQLLAQGSYVGIVNHLPSGTTYVIKPGETITADTQDVALLLSQYGCVAAPQSPNPMQTVTVTITSAELLALTDGGDGVLIVPPQGEGLAAIMQYCVYACQGGTVPYTTGSGGLYYLSPIDSNNAIDNGDNSLLTTGISGFRTSPTSGAQSPATAAINGGIFYGIPHLGTLFTGGDGNMVITLGFTVQPLF